MRAKEDIVHARALASWGVYLVVRRYEVGE